MLKKQVSPKIVAIVFGVIVVCFAIAVYVSAWTEPSAVPPGANVPAPLNVSNTGQTKVGGLALNTGVDGIVSADGAPNGLLIYDGNVGIGTAVPSEKLEVSGNIEASGTICDGAGGCTRRTYVSPWQLIRRSAAGSPQTVTFNHPLGTDQIIITIQIRYGGVIHQQHNSDYGGWGLGVEAYEITSTQIKVSAGEYIRYFTSTGMTFSVPVANNAEIRILAIKID